MPDKLPEDLNLDKLFAAIHKDVAEGEAIVAKAREDYELPQGPLSDGELMRRWRQGQLAAPPALPLLDAEMVASVRIAVANRRQRPIIAGLALAQVWRALNEPDSWDDFLKATFPDCPPAEIRALIGRVVQRGATHRCICCGAEVRSACDCGSPYLSTALPIVTRTEIQARRLTDAHQIPAHQISHETRGRRPIGAKPLTNTEKSRRYRAKKAAEAAGSSVPEALAPDHARWLRHLAYVAGDVPAALDQWQAEFGPVWRDFRATSDLVSLAREAAQTWGALDLARRARIDAELYLDPSLAHQPEEHCPDCDGDEAVWQWRLATLAADAIAMPSLWTREFGDAWRDYAIQPLVLARAEDATRIWTQLLNDLTERRKA